MDGWIYRWMDGLIDGLLVGLIDGWTDRWMGGHTYLEACSRFITWAVFCLALMYSGFNLLSSISFSLIFFSMTALSRENFAISCLFNFNCSSHNSLRLV